MKRWAVILLCLCSPGPSNLLTAQEAPGIISTVPGISYDHSIKVISWGDGEGGMTVDARGNLYVSSKCMVFRKSPDGPAKPMVGKDYDDGWGGHSFEEFFFLMSIADGISATESLVFSTLAGGSLNIRLGLILPSGMATDLKGNLYIASGDRHRIRRASADGYIWTAAGNGDTARIGPTVNTKTGLRDLEIRPGFSGDGGLARQAFLNKPTDVALDAQGNLYIADYDNGRIRLVNGEGYIWTFAGNGEQPLQAGALGDGGPAALAVLYTPVSVAVDLSGNVYVAELYAHRIRRIAPDGRHTITTVAGTGEAGFSGDGGPAIQARLNYPMGIAVDATGNVYIADYQNHRVRRIDPEGIITTYAGTGQSGVGDTGDGLPATQARLPYPRNVAADQEGYVYVTCLESESKGVVRRVSPVKKHTRPSIRLSEASVRLEATKSYTTTEKTLLFSNPAKETPLQVELLIVDNPPEFKILPTHFLVPAAGSQTVQVRFTPTSQRTASATMLVYHDGVEENPMRVSLSFEGTIRSADFDGDGKVGLDDFFLFAGAFGKGVTADKERYDLDGDYKIGFDDFFLFSARFGK